jgi:hypothetical protein
MNRYQRFDLEIAEDPQQLTIESYRGLFFISFFAVPALMILFFLDPLSRVDNPWIRIGGIGGSLYALFVMSRIILAYRSVFIFDQLRKQLTHRFTTFKLICDLTFLIKLWAPNLTQAQRDDLITAKATRKYHFSQIREVSVETRDDDESCVRYYSLSLLMESGEKLTILKDYSLNTLADDHSERLEELNQFFRLIDDYRQY